MKRIIILIITTLISTNLFAQNTKNASISFDPFSIFGVISFLSTSADELTPADRYFNSLYFDMDINWETEKQKEMGVGIFLGAHKVALKTKYRSFYNKERQNGFFWGLYGLIEWRRMYWFYDKDNNDQFSIGWNLPFTENDNVYHSLGITGGFDIGFRFRIENLGITPYLGLGLPLYFCFGNLPNNNIKEFDILNTTIRAISIGLKLDFFND